MTIGLLISRSLRPVLQLTGAKTRGLVDAGDRATDVAAPGRRDRSWPPLAQGRSIFAPDRGHLHHCLRSRLRERGRDAGRRVHFWRHSGPAGPCWPRLMEWATRWRAWCIAFSVGLLTCTNTFGATESRLLVFRLKVALVPSAVGPGRPSKECRPRVPPSGRPGLGGCLGRPGPRRRGQWSPANRTGDRNDVRPASCTTATGVCRSPAKNNRTGRSFTRSMPAMWSPE